jgi:fucose permease
MNSSPIEAPLSRLSLVLCVFLPFSLGQFMHALLRNANAVLVPDLVATFSLNPGQLGLLTSTFFFSVVLAQLPTSAALERYGPYKVQLVLLLLAARAITSCVKLWLCAKITAPPAASSSKTSCTLYGP